MGRFKTYIFCLLEVGVRKGWAYEPKCTPKMKKHMLDQIMLDKENLPPLFTLKETN